jgi:hypothetical protein
VRPDACSGSAVSSHPAFSRERVVPTHPASGRGYFPAERRPHPQGGGSPRIVISRAADPSVGRIVAWLGLNCPSLSLADMRLEVPPPRVVPARIVAGRRAAMPRTALARLSQ